MKEVQVVTGYRHLGSYIRLTSLRNEYVQSKILEWEYVLDQLTMVAKYHPQAAFTGFTKYVMNRMIFLMRTIPDVDELFKPIETSISQKFLPALFDTSAIDANIRNIIALPVKKSGMGIFNPVAARSTHYRNSQVMCLIFIAAIRGKSIFRLTDHITAAHCTRNA